MLIHEIGHTLGAKHPHETVGPETVLPPDQDWRGASLMSYRDFAGGSVSDGASSSVYPTGPMALDVDWVRSIYGDSARSNLGDTTYGWKTGQKLLDTIVDDGGNDTIDWSNQSKGATFDLRGGWQEAGPAYRWDEGSLATTLYLYGNSTIENAYGGSGDDQITGNAKANLLVGNAGNDRLDGQGGDDRLVGGAGDDVFVIHGGSGHEEITDASGGADRLEFSSGFSISDLVFVTSGSDLHIQSAPQAMQVDLVLVNQNAGEAVEQLLFTGVDDALYLWNGSSFSADPTGGSPPTEGSDLLILTDGPDTLYALGGDDIVFGKAGDDYIDGGNGRDYVVGGLGDDQLIGGNGADKLDGGDGTDRLFGGAGADILRGGLGDDIIQAGDSDDIAFGGPGNDTDLWWRRLRYPLGGRPRCRRHLRRWWQRFSRWRIRRRFGGWRRRQRPGRGWHGRRQPRRLRRQRQLARRLRRRPVGRRQRRRCPVRRLRQRPPAAAPAATPRSSTARSTSTRSATSRTATSKSATSLPVASGMAQTS